MHKVVVQEGYSLPFASFGAAKRKKSKSKGKRKGPTAAQKRARAKFKKCAKSWSNKSVKFRNTHSYRAHVKKCFK